MARENVSEESNSIGISSKSNGIDITCPQCESRLTCDRRDSTCPDCGASFSVRTQDGFTLVERGEWTVAVSFAGPSSPGAMGDG